MLRPLWERSSLQRVNGEEDEDEGGVATVVTKQKRSRNQRRKAKAAAAAAPAPAAAEPEKPVVPTAEIRIEGLPGGTLAGTTLRSDGRDVTTVSAEQLSNTAGARGEDHTVPLDILADAARRAKSRWKSWKADETAGGNAFDCPVGSDTTSDVFIDTWAQDKHLDPSWR